MARKYPTKMFLLFVITNFFLNHFYLFVPGAILCIAGIWNKTCMEVGLAILGLDLVLSIMTQMRLRKAAVTPSDNPEFNELMDAFCGPNGMEAVRSIVDEKIKTANPMKDQENN